VGLTVWENGSDKAEQNEKTPGNESRREAKALFSFFSGNNEYQTCTKSKVVH